jgi:hypothetical protein
MLLEVKVREGSNTSDTQEYRHSGEEGELGPINCRASTTRHTTFHFLTVSSWGIIYTMLVFKSHWEVGTKISTLWRCGGIMSEWMGRLYRTRVALEIFSTFSAVWGWWKPQSPDGEITLCLEALPKDLCGPGHMNSQHDDLLWFQFWFS